MTADPFIPLVRLENETVWDTLEPALRELVTAGRFVLGPELEEFERAAARAFGCSWAVGTSSGTSALYLALRAAPLPVPAWVALPANTFYATFEAVVAAGHVPVVVDHDDDHLISVDALEQVDVDAVVAVHLYGLPAVTERLGDLVRRRGWWLLEDASQSHGATAGGRPAGSLGDAAAFSAYPTKNLGAWGDAGFITGNDPGMEAELRSLRDHGQRQRHLHEAVAGPHRLDNLQALVLTEKLRRLPDEVRARRRVASWYHEALDGLGLDLPGDRGDRTHVYHRFVVPVPDRDAVRRRLAEAGVGTGVDYPTPVHLQPGARNLCEVPRPPRNAETSAGRVLSLPMHAQLTPAEVDRVADALRSALAARRPTRLSTA
ncbi:MAG TPA: DegT/DnrJ/EryC1/StrS family aminotransferase [Acidimicrobiales bacterium]|nr:DegT/DnrJ/EryC1/StrS family aminotransferase [Acidimicrobiales bacterium]